MQLIIALGCTLAYGLSGPLFAQKRRNFLTLLLLITPFFFITLAVFIGRVPINVPELPPYVGLFNERYGLTWIGFTVSITMLFISQINEAVVRKILLIGLLLFAIAHLLSQIVPQYPIIRLVPNEDCQVQEEAAKFLKYEYKGGGILMYHFKNEDLFFQSQIPFDEITNEMNYKIFEKVASEPWAYVDWVLSFKQSKGSDVISRIEKVTYFQKVFEKVYEDNYRVIYHRRWFASSITSFKWLR